MRGWDVNILDFTYEDQINLIMKLVETEPFGLTRKQFSEAIEEACPDDINALSIAVQKINPFDPIFLAMVLEKHQEPIKEKSYIHRLHYPLKYGSETVEEIEIKRPRYKEMKNLNPGTLKNSQVLDLLAPLAAFSRTKADMIEVYDFTEIKEVISNFLYSGHVTLTKQEHG